MSKRIRPDEANFISGYVNSLDEMLTRLKVELVTSSEIQDFDVHFYYDLFNYRDFYAEDNGLIRNDPFYSIHKHCKQITKVVRDLWNVLESFGHQKELPSVFFSIVQYRTKFLKLMIKSMCSSYTIETQKIERVALSDELKSIIDNSFVQGIHAQHRLYFADVTTEIRNTKSYIDMCKLLTPLKNPVKDICAFRPQDIIRNEMENAFFDHQVPGCLSFTPITENASISTTTANYLFEDITTNQDMNSSIHHMSRRSIDSTNSASFLLVFLIPLIFVIMCLKLLFRSYRY